MSSTWNDYIVNIVSQSKNGDGVPQCAKGCILGMEGGTIWNTLTRDLALQLQGSEASDIAKCFRTKDFSLFMKRGVYAEGKKYLFIKDEEGTVAYGKGITLQATKCGVIVAICTKDGNQPAVNRAVDVVAGYLQSLNM